MRAAAPAPCGVRSEPPAPSCGATTCEVRRPGPVDKGTADRACPLIHRPADGGPAGAGNAKICGNVTPSVTRSFEATRTHKTYRYSIRTQHDTINTSLTCEGRSRYPNRQKGLRACLLYGKSAGRGC